MPSYPTGTAFASSASPLRARWRRSAPLAPAHPLVGCYRIIKAPQDRVLPAGGAAALVLLLSCSPFVNRDPPRSDALVANLKRLAAAVEQKELSFSLNGAAAGLSEAETAKV